MLTSLIIKDVVLIESLDLTVGPGLTALTGETGAGKSIILDALGLATGARADAGLVRRGAAQAVVTAIFDLPSAHAVWPVLEEKGLTSSPGEELILRRVLSADGRSRAFVNDQAASVGVLKELGNLLLEVHGQHETVGLLDPRNHRPLLDHFGGVVRWYWPVPKPGRGGVKPVKRSTICERARKRPPPRSKRSVFAWPNSIFWPLCRAKKPNWQASGPCWDRPKRP